MSPTAGPIRIAILSNGRQARADIARTAGSLGAIQRSASRATKVFAGIFALSALKRAAVAVGKIGATYVDSLNKIQALTGANDRQMSRIADRLEEQSGAFAKFGQTTGDAAQGMVELTKSGLSARKALAAVRGTMTLAKAGELEVADASELVANTLNTFNLRASKAAKIANSLANAANISSANVSDVAESFKYVAPLAAKANVSVDQTNALLAELANSGIKASQAGTSLRTFLLGLQAPSAGASTWLEEMGVSVYNTEGKMRPLASLIEQLQRGLRDLSTEDQNFALKSIFGKTGITGAQVILKGGVEGLRDYTAGVKRAGAANKLAASASKGLAGTIASIKAQAESTTQALYRQYSPALDAQIQSAVGYLRDHEDQIRDTASVVADQLGPALKELAELAKNTGEAFADTAVPLAQKLLPALGDLVELTGDAAQFLNELPGPIKDIAVQAGIAALVLPRLTAGVTSASTSMLAAARSAQIYGAAVLNAETRSTALGLAALRLSAAAKNAAGIGGMVALTAATQTSNKGMQALLGTLGGAATGFALGGPIGALIGGAGVGLVGLYQATRQSKEEAQRAVGTWQNYASTLDQVTGATTRATRQMAIQSLMESGALKNASEIGVSRQTIISATLGEEKARRRLVATLKQQQAAVDALVAEGSKGISSGNQPADQQRILGEATARQKVIDAIRAEIGETSKAITKKTTEIALTERIPRRLVTRFQNEGLPKSIDQVRALAKNFKLTPRQVRTVFRMTDIDLSRKKVRGLAEELGRTKPAAERARRSLEDVGKAKPSNKWVTLFSADMDRARGQAGKGTTGIIRELEKVQRAQANLSAFRTSLRTGINGAQSDATTGGQQVGSNLKAGVIAGFAGTQAQLAAQAAAAVRAAVAAARAAGKIHSPSQEMRDKVGKPLADGIAVGFIAGVRNGSTGISRALDKLMELIEKKYDGKKQAGKRKAVIRSLRDERAELVKNGKAQDKVNRLLEKAEQRYKSLRQRADDYAKAIAGGFRSYGSIVGLGTTGGGTSVSLPAILSQLAARASIAEQFASVIEGIRKKLNKTSLQQLLDQASSGDLEGALATAQAIAAGGQGAIAQINALTAQINEAGKELGAKMRRQFFGHGLQVAEGVVKGLEKRQRELDRIADKLAKEFLRQAGLNPGGGRKPTGNDRTAVVQPRTSALDTYMTTRPAASAPSTVRIRLTAEQISQLQRGKQIQADLDVYRGAGGRSKVRVAGS